MAVALHWIVALALVGQVLLGWYVHEIPRGTPARGWWINLHKSTGLLLGLLVLFRLGWRLRQGAPARVTGLPAWQRYAAGASHALLYACMLALPLTGYLASNFSRHGIKFFNTALLPPWGADDKAVYAALNGAHVALTWVLVALVALHVLAALTHLVRRDGVFARMVPAAG
ncbi:cytochrome b [Ramlibacter cellulosilyticus]|nr:cytochrome b [Ramlibacter cellulosilyticus]